MNIPRHLLRHGDGRALYVYGALRGKLSSRPSEHDLGRPQPSELHQRYEPLTDSWVAISPARNTRPDSSATTHGAPACPLCPGGIEVPFAYDAAVFENRFPSFAANPPAPPQVPGAEPSLGRCEVVLYTQRHDASLGSLAPDELARLIGIWTDRSSDLWADPRHAFVMIFENRGPAVGATLAHPHGQIYAFDRLPPNIAARVRALAINRRRNGTCLGCDLTAPMAVGGLDQSSPDSRCVERSDAFAVGVPFAARWPYEIHVRARRHGSRRLADLKPNERVELARVLHRVAERYDSLFEIELPYMMVVYEAPSSIRDWHLSFEFYPPARTARQLKIRASVETATGLFINDTLPETSAATLAAIVVPEREEAPTVEIGQARLE